MCKKKKNLKRYSYLSIQFCIVLIFGIINIANKKTKTIRIKIGKNNLKWDMTEANEPNYIFVNNVTTLKRMEKKIIQISWEKTIFD